MQCRHGVGQLWQLLRQFGCGDSNAAPGVITDPAGAAVPGDAAATNAIPTLGEWALMMLARLMGLMALVGRGALGGVRQGG